MDKDLRVKELEERICLYEEILNHSMEGVLITNMDEEVVWLNNAVCQMEDLNLEHCKGLKEQELWPNLKPPSCHYSVKTGKQSPESFLQFFNRQGEKLDMLSTTYPFYSEGKQKFVYSMGYYLGYSDNRVKKIYEFRQNNNGKKQQFDNETSYTFDDITGNSAALTATLDIARKVALRNTPVMIYGQTGTGKELFAQGIHNASAFKNGKFIAVNCASIPDNLMETTLFGVEKGAYTGAEKKEGLLAAAEGGSLFLDEINSMPLSIQGKLLRILQENKYSPVGSTKIYHSNCRIISASNQTPEFLSENKILRQDLFFRLAVITIEIPTLTQRTMDIPRLVDHFIHELNTENDLHIVGVDPDCNTIFQHYSWPGNVRELRHVIEYMMNVTDQKKTLSVYDLPPYLLKKYSSGTMQKPMYSRALPLKESLRNMEKSIITNALLRNRGNMSATSKELGIHREALYKRISRLDINLDTVRKSTEGIIDVNYI